MRLAFRLVDVFTDRPLAGNQLCVVPEPGSISSETMQAIAREIGFAETTFVTRASRDRYEMRIFTPGAEIPFAGHPSLGTAYVLASEGRTRTAVTQSVAAGETPIEVDLSQGTARMEQLPPIFRPPFTGSLLDAAGLRPEDLHPELPSQVVSTGLAHLIVPAVGEEVVRWAQPDPRRLTQVLDEAGGTGLYLFSLEEGRIDARMFAPGVGVDEDAATGSAAGPLGAYLVRHGVVPAGHLTIFQGKEIGRPSTLEVDVEGEGEGLRVFVGGGVHVVGEGVFVLPD
jgi:trans-2,3-dihydro-3-hydroxyanthranilate isomerase